MDLTDSFAPHQHRNRVLGSMLQTIAWFLSRIKDKADKHDISSLKPYVDRLNAAKTEIDELLDTVAAVYVVNDALSFVDNTIIPCLTELNQKLDLLPYLQECHFSTDVAVLLKDSPVRDQTLQLLQTVNQIDAAESDHRGRHVDQYGNEAESDHRGRHVDQYGNEAESDHRGRHVDHYGNAAESDHRGGYEHNTARSGYRTAIRHVEYGNPLNQSAFGSVQNDNSATYGRMYNYMSALRERYACMRCFEHDHTEAECENERLCAKCFSYGDRRTDHVKAVCPYATCSICQEKGHSADLPCLKPRRCHKCLQLAHKWSTCPNEITCRNCFQAGHFASVCPVLCQKCFKSGHNPNFCKECHYCHDWGHKKEDCPKKRCHKCNQVGHKQAHCPLNWNQQS